MFLCLLVPVICLWSRWGVRIMSILISFRIRKNMGWSRSRLKKLRKRLLFTKCMALIRISQRCLKSNALVLFIFLVMVWLLRKSASKTKTGKVALCNLMKTLKQTITEVMPYFWRTGIVLGSICTQMSCRGWYRPRVRSLTLFLWLLVIQNLLRGFFLRLVLTMLLVSIKRVRFPTRQL